tara:strand:+ start:31083 stop:32078 length:996 start_codon:yes stop_codon:yes gene_type:complete
MGYTKPTETTKHFLETSALPTHGDTYTVIPHKDVISHTESLLKSNGFTIERELYKANMNAQVAQGIYHIKPIQQVFNLYSSEVKEETEIGMMFAWTNSYDKSTRFQCAIGGYVFACTNGLICGDMANFARKHTGAADSEVSAQISSQIKHAHKFFKNIVNDKNSMKTITLSVQEQSELLGRLFFDNKLLDVTQMSCIRSEMNDPSYDYNADADNAWTFYNHVTHALKKCHPRNWLSDQQKFHDFIVADVLGKMGILPTDNTPDPAVQEDIIIDDTDSDTIPSVQEQSADRLHISIEEKERRREAKANEEAEETLSSPKDVEIDVEDDQWEL